MAGVRDDDRQVSLPGYGRGRRSPGVVGMVFVAVLAAIALILILSRRPAYRPAAPAVSAVPAAVPPAQAAPEPAATVRPAVPPEPRERPLTNSEQAQIARVVRDGRPALTACYQRALVRDATLVHARLNVRLSIAASGRVDDVAISGPAAFRPLEPCLAAAIDNWTFPSAASPYKTEFPLVLQGTE